MLSKGFPRNPGELSISALHLLLTMGRYRPPRETGGDRDRWTSSLTNP